GLCVVCVLALGGWVRTEGPSPSPTALQHRATGSHALQLWLLPPTATLHCRAFIECFHGLPSSGSSGYHTHYHMQNAPTTQAGGTDTSSNSLTQPTLVSPTARSRESARKSTGARPRVALPAAADG